MQIRSQWMSAKPSLYCLSRKFIIDTTIRLNRDNVMVFKVREFVNIRF